MATYMCSTEKDMTKAKCIAAGDSRLSLNEAAQKYIYKFRNRDMTKSHKVHVWVDHEYGSHHGYDLHNFEYVGFDYVS